MHPLYAVLDLRMQAATLRRIRCVTAIVASSLRATRPLPLLPHPPRAQKFLQQSAGAAAVYRVCVACFFVPCASVLLQLPLSAAPTIMFAGKVIVSVQLQFLKS